jgi:hypothetical protein
MAINKAIPIAKGLRIVLGESGEPQAFGAPIDEAVKRVEEWIEANPRHPQVEEAKRWLLSAEQADRQRVVKAKAEKIAKPALDRAERISDKKLRNVAKKFLEQAALEQAEKDVK